MIMWGAKALQHDPILQNMGISIKRQSGSKSDPHPKEHHRNTWVHLQVTSPPPRHHHEEGLCYPPRACIGDVGALSLSTISSGLHHHLGFGTWKCPSSNLKASIGVHWVHLGTSSIK